jgi:hypothetical protein
MQLGGEPVELHRGHPECVLGRCKTGILGGIDGEEWMEPIIVDILFDVVEAETPDVKEPAVEDLELVADMICALHLPAQGTMARNSERFSSPRNEC